MIAATIITGIGVLMALSCIGNIALRPSTPAHEFAWVLGVLVAAVIIAFGLGVVSL